MKYPLHRTELKTPFTDLSDSIICLMHHECENTSSFAVSKIASSSSWGDVSVGSSPHLLGLNFVQAFIFASVFFTLKLRRP